MFRETFNEPNLSTIPVKIIWNNVSEILMSYISGCFQSSHRMKEKQISKPKMSGTFNFYKIRDLIKKRFTVVSEEIKQIREWIEQNVFTYLCAVPTQISGNETHILTYCVC